MPGAAPCASGQTRSRWSRIRATRSTATPSTRGATTSRTTTRSPAPRGHRRALSAAQPAAARCASAMHDDLRPRRRRRRCFRSRQRPHVRAADRGRASSPRRAALTMYTGRRCSGGEYERSAFVAEPVHNLVHRDVLSQRRRRRSSRAGAASRSRVPRLRPSVVPARELLRRARRRAVRHRLLPRAHRAPGVDRERHAARTPAAMYAGQRSRAASTASFVIRPGLKSRPHSLWMSWPPTPDSHAGARRSVRRRAIGSSPRCRTPMRGGGAPPSVCWWRATIARSCRHCGRSRPLRRRRSDGCTPSGRWTGSAHSMPT